MSESLPSDETFIISMLMEAHEKLDDILSILRDDEEEETEDESDA